MPKLSAFVGRSFHKEDSGLVNTFLKHFDTFKKLGFHCEDAEEAESKSVAEKVKAKMANKQVFIGIFTRKYPVADWFARQLNPNDMRWFSRFLWQKNNISTASGWTTQESGFAIGKDLKLILLVEEGVIDIGGLHGDHEIIQFSRENPEKCFPALDAQIISLLAEPEKPEEQRDAQSVPELPESPSPKKELMDEGGKKEDAERHYLVEIYAKLFDEKDEEGAKKVLAEWLREAKTEGQQVHRRAVYQSFRLSAGHPDAFVELEGLVKEYPTHPSPLLFLGRGLNNLGQFSSAADRLKEAAERATDDQRRATLLVEAAHSLAKDNKYVEATNLLLDALSHIGRDPAVGFELCKGLAQIADVHKDNDQHDLRFQLAYKYSNMGRYALALYHYKILANEAPDGLNLNNLGVAYAELGLPARAVTAYKRAANFDETLAMANLAYKFIQEGFLDEANDLIERALPIKDRHQNIASALAKISDVKQEEEAREQEILKGIDEERKFRLGFAEATSVKVERVPAITGRWKTPHGEIDIAMGDGILKGLGVSRETEAGSLFEALLPAPFAATPRQVTKTVRLDATLQGAGARGQIVIETKAGTILSSTKQEFKVHLIISSKERIRLLQVDDKNVISLANLDLLPEA